MLKTKIWLILLVAINFIQCHENNYKEQVYAFPEFEVAKHWTLRLPANIRKTSVKDNLYQDVFEFSNDSMMMKVSIDRVGEEMALSNFNFIIKNEKQNKASGPCLGDFTGYAKFHNFLDTLNGLSGTILDLEENGKKTVCFRVEEVRTGNALDLAFEALSSERRDLIHAAVKTIKYLP